MQKNNADVDEAIGGVIGIQTTLRRSDVSVGDIVFIRSKRTERLITICSQVWLWEMALTNPKPSFVEWSPHYFP